VHREDLLSLGDEHKLREIREVFNDPQRSAGFDIPQFDVETTFIDRKVFSVR